MVTFQMIVKLTFFSKVVDVNLEFNFNPQILRIH